MAAPTMLIMPFPSPEEKYPQRIVIADITKERPLMDRVKNFSEKVTKVINIFDTKEVELPFTDAEWAK